MKQEGYKYHFDRGIYYNKQAKKIFSEEAVDDNDEKWLNERIKEKNNDEWSFYTNEPIARSMKKEVLEDILK